MKRQLIIKALLLLIFAQVAFAQIPQTISYQGVLTDAQGNAVSDGDYLLVFRLYDASEGGTVLWEEKQSVAITSGIFGVILGKEIELNRPFDRPYWLSIELSENGTELTPRIELTAAAYSLNARSVADSAVTGEKIADGQVVRVLQISPINGFTASLKDTVRLKAGANITFDAEGGPNAGIIISATGVNGASDGWSLAGNAGTDTLVNFLGTTDDRALELRVNNRRALRIEPAENPEFGFSPNVIGGFSGNNVAAGVVGTTIGGGGLTNFANSVTASFATVGGGGGNTASSLGATVSGGSENTASDDGATVGGGKKNAAGANGATVSGGEGNTASGPGAAVGGGGDNTASGFGATVGGGLSNKARGDFSTVSGGGGTASPDSNSATGNYSTVPGGRSNVAQGDYSFAAGRRARANHTGAFVWADATDANFFSTAENQFLIRASGGVGIGTTNPQADLHIKSTDARIRLTDSFTGQSWDIYTGGSPGDLEFEDVNNGTTPFIIKGLTGNVGIGTNSPSSRLHIEGGADVTPVGGAFITVGAISSINVAIDNNEIMARNNGSTASLNLNFEGGRIILGGPSGGNVGIGITNPTEKLHVNGNALADAHTTPSSRRWKTNIETIKDPLETVQALRGVTYDWKASGKHDIGLIAEEVGEVIPEIVVYEKNGIDAKSVDYPRLVAVLIEAVKELSAKVERLESAKAPELAQKK